MTYYFKVLGEYLECSNQRKEIVSNSINYHTAHFTLDSTWNGFSLTATFINTKTKVSKNVPMGVLVDCVIPWEVLASDVEGGYLEVGITGISGDDKRRTDMINTIAIVPSTANNGTDPLPPTQSVYDEIMDLVQGVGTNYIAGNNITIADDTISSNQIDDTTSSLTKTYSSSKTDATYERKIYNVKLFGTKSGTYTVNLTDTAPSILATNYIETVNTNNITIDWVNGLNMTFTRVASAPIKLKKGDTTTFNIYTAFNRDCSVEFGAISYIDGVPITTPQAFGNQDFSGVSGFTTVQVLKYEMEFDLLGDEPVEYPAGTIFTTKLFKRQETSTPTLTTRYLYGVNTNGLDRISYAKVKTNI